MFIHTHQVISKLFKEYFNRLSDLKPINLLGPSGVGKITYIKEFIRQLQCERYKPFFNVDSDYLKSCNCSICKKILNEEATDILFLDSGGSIQDIRDKVNSFIDSYPVEYDLKFLVVQDLQKFNKNELDIFLNIFEEPPDYLKIFTTASDLKSVSTPIQSRLQSFELSVLDQGAMKKIVENSSKLEAYSFVLNKYSFKTIDELIYYNKFIFEELFLDLYMRVGNSYNLNKTLTKFLNLVREQYESQFFDIILFFLEFYLVRLYEFCKLNENNIKVVSFRDYIQMKLIPNFMEYSFNYFNHLEQYKINVETQLFNFFNLIFMLKKIVGI